MQPPRQVVIPSDRVFYILNAILSAGALSFLAYILLIHRGSGTAGLNLRFLPAVNASLNATSAVLLTAGYFLIRRRAVRLHRYCMVAAFITSSLFLVCYLLYHSVHGDTRYQGTGPIRVVYFVILGSHVLLSMTIVPLALSSLYFATKRTFAKHKRISRWTLPIWLYVSVTGVLVFWMLRGSTPAVP